MVQHIETPVLIVGAGPVGLALALDLGWRNVPCLVIEQDDGGVGFSKIGHIAVRTMEFMRRWGIARAVREAGFPDDFRMSRVICTTVKARPLHVEEHKCLRDMPLPDYSCEKKQRCPQHWFQPILQQAALAHPSVSARYGWKLESFEQSDEWVTAQVTDLSNGEPIAVSAQYLVACDGIASTVRDGLGIAMHGNPRLSYSIGVTARIPDMLAHCHYGPAERFIFLGPEGTWGNLTTVDGRETWRLTVLGTAEKLDLDLFDPAQWIRRALGRDDARFEVLNVLPWRRREVTADRFRAGRIFLAGDAAHGMSPTGGMGMNTGIGDAVDLGWKLQALVEGWGGTRLMDAYGIERRPVAVRTAASSTSNFKVLTSPRNCEHILDEGEAGELARSRISAEFTAAMRASYWEPSGIQMGYSYEGSPLIVADGTPATPDHVRYVQTGRPGGRAPHAWLADGRSTLDLFGRDFVLMKFPAARDADAASVETAAANAGMPLTTVPIGDPHIEQLYGAPLVLVRPDGHVAWRGYSPGNAGDIVDTVRGCGA